MSTMYQNCTEIGDPTFKIIVVPGGVSTSKTWQSIVHVKISGHSTP